MSPTTCSNCGAEKPIGTLQCPECGHTPEFVWGRAAAEDPSQPEVDQPGAGAAQGPPGSLQPGTGASTPYERQRTERPGCLTAYAILIGINGALVVVGGLVYTVGLGVYDALTILLVMLIFGVVGALFIGLAIGLWKLKNWARILVIIFQSLGFISGIGGLISGNLASLVGMAISGVILYWFATNGDHFH